MSRPTFKEYLDGQDLPPAIPDEDQMLLALHSLCKATSSQRGLVSRMFSTTLASLHGKVNADKTSYRKIFDALRTLQDTPGVIDVLDGTAGPVVVHKAVSKKLDGLKTELSSVLHIMQSCAKVIEELSEEGAVSP